MSDLSKLMAEISPEQRELLLLRLGKKKAQIEDAYSSQITHQDRGQSSYPLSYEQLRLWFIDQLDPGSPVYNVYFAFRLRGSLNVNALEQSFNNIVSRHEILRATFTTVNDQPVQVISAETQFSLPVVDLSDLPHVEREAEVERRVVAETRLPFDLARGPLFRVNLYKLAEQEHVLQVTLHHIVSDGWSLEVLLSELSSWYQFFTLGANPPNPLTLSYLDYVYWQKEKVEGEMLREQLPYWRQQLKGATPVMDLPVKGSRPTRQTFNGANQKFLFSTGLTQALKALSQRAGTTLYMTLLAAFQLLLHRYTGKEDILVGSPSAGRSRVETEGLVGMFVNTLLLRSDLSGNPTFRELLARVREVALGAMAHQDLPFDKLVEDLQPERSLSHMPLFNVAFVFQKGAKQRLELSALTATRLQIEGATAKFDLTLYLTEDANGLEGVLEYNTDLFAEDTSKRMVGHFETLLEGIVADPDRRISILPLLTTPEEHQLLAEWNNTKVDYSRDKCVHELFQAQTDSTPDAIALMFEREQLSYQELNRRANRVANYLIQQGVGPDVLVGICMERSVELIVALLGILKAGGAYLPLDPASPREHFQFMLSDARVRVLLTQQHLAQSLSDLGVELVALDTDEKIIARQSAQNPPNLTAPENLAYVMYTSGSSGQPKGVAVTHRAVVRLVKGSDYARQTSDEVFLHFAPISFDASTFEIWGSLLNGARLVVFPPHLPSLEELGQALVNYKVTTLWLTAGLFQEMVGNHLQYLSGLRQLLAGGDVLATAAIKRAVKELKNCQLINGYGPTENTTFTCCYQISSWDSDDPIPIGRPISNTQVHILDRNLQPVPVGITGELCIGGDGLARGYHDRPDLTAEKFIPNPLSENPGACLYRTGDLARYLPDGNISFLGRFDNQIKLRGFRIELGEIEAVLGQHPAVLRTVVTTSEDTPGNKRLIAYIVVDPECTTTNTELREFMSRKLPDYMLPAAFIMLDQLPLTPNGKVDYRALPAPDQLRPLLQTAFVPARNPLEEMLSGIWAEILGLERIGVHDNFFELGGHSLLATQVISRVRKMFALELPLRVAFEAPTVAEMAEKIVKWQGDDSDIPELIPRAPGAEIALSFAQQRLWFLDQLEPGSCLFNIPIAIQLSGQLSVEALRETVVAIVERHEILRTNYVAAEGQPKQVVRQNETPQLKYVDLRSSEQELSRSLLEDALRPFSLSDDLLLRATLFQLSETENVLLLTTHHIAADGWSMGILFREIAHLYEAFAAGKPSPLPNLRIQYGDYAIWQRRWLRGETFEKELSYWRTQLRGAPPVLELPTDRPRPLGRSVRGSHHSMSLPESLTLEIKKLSRQEGVTLFMLLLAVFQILLSRHVGHEDIVVGTDVANRTRLETEGLIGFFVNLLVLRTDLSGNSTFREVLRRVREVTLGAYAHQQMPFEKLVEELQPERSLSRNPLVQVLFVLQNAPLQALDLPSLTVKSLDIKTGTSKFDLGLFVREDEQKLSGTWVYNTDLFDDRSVINMARQYETLLGNLLAQPDARLSEIEMVDDAGKARQNIEKQERQLTRRRNLLSARRKVVDLSKTRGVKTDYLSANERLPLLARPDVQDIDLLDWARSNRAFVDQELLKHGAILFRDFNLVSATEFEQFALTLCPNLFGEYGDLPREGVEGKIYGSTPYPADQTILFHNESSHMHRWPMKIWFFCVKAAEQGGETPIVDCRRVYDLMDPRVRDRFVEKKLMYVRNYTEGLDVSWQTFFHTTDRSVVEDYCRKAAIDFEWNNGSLKTRQICDAVVRHPETGEMVFFNQLQLHHVSCLQPEVRDSLLSMVREEDLPRNVYYGDGSAIEDSVIQEIRELYFKLAVSFQWQPGDVLMLNNMLTAHARNPYVGARKIVVAMGEMMTKNELSSKGA